MGLHDSKYENGREVMDSRPMAVPVGFRRPPSLIDQMRVMIRREMSEAAAARGAESFEEANDFDVGDDPDDPTTPWEHAADGDEEVAQGLEDAKMARLARAAGYAPPPPVDGLAHWAERNGWVKASPSPSPSPKPSDQPAQPAQAPSAGANLSSNPTSGA